MVEAATATKPARSRRAPAPPAVVFHRNNPDAPQGGHDQQTKAVVAQSLAALLGAEWAGEFDPLRRYAGKLYVVPSDTLQSQAQARRLGVRSASDLYGGVVPYPFVATKMISHPLVAADAFAPEGWSRAHAALIDGAVLPGRSAFAIGDARRAGAAMLDAGPVRLKDPCGVGGTGQWVVASGAELDAHLADVDPARIARVGLVLERDLSRVVTYSVGQVQAGPLTAAYHGTQTLTLNHHGHAVYGGSTLNVVRGGFDALLVEDLDDDVRTAVAQTIAYHRAAGAAYKGFYASRCNYDVARGVDARGDVLSGVLEQSWRIGGASGAEIAALHALVADPALQRVRASTHEIYGDGAVVPDGAWVLYAGVDAHVGRLTKYVTIER